MGAIIRISIRGIRTHLGRLALTLVAITLGVSFVSGTFILADSMTEVFDSIVERASADTDGQVQPITDLEFGETGVQISDTLIAELQDLPEVGLATGFVEGPENGFLVIDQDGEAVANIGPPILSFSWDGESSDEGFKLLEGVAPSRANEVAIDTLQADKAGVTAGQTVSFSTPEGTQELTITGIVSFEGSAGAWFTLFDLETAQHQFGKTGLVDVVSLQAATTSNAADMLTAVAGVVPAGVEVLDQTAVIEDGSEEFNQIIRYFTIALLSFAAVALFVSLFIIKNTFSILIGQRTREIGMLRAIGAGANHIRVSILVEALIVGIIGSLLGLTAGIAISELIQWIISQGGGFPDVGRVIATRTIVVTFIVGIVATVGSAMIPAFKASKIAPIAAMNGIDEADEGNRRRTTFGAIIGAAGIALMTLGLFGSGLSVGLLLPVLGLGAILVFISVAMLSVVFAGPAVRVIGAPIARLTGVSGRMAVQNAARSPQRTASTASALMIGLALITTVMVLGQSLKTSLGNTISTSMQADIFIFHPEGGDVPAALLTAVTARDNVESVGRVIDDEILVSGQTTLVGGFDTTTGTDIVDLGVAPDVIRGLADGGVMLFEDKAEDLGLAVGDTVDVGFVDGVTQTLTIEAIHPTQGMFGGIDWIVDAELLLDHNAGLAGASFGIVLVDGTDVTAATAEFDNLASEFGSVEALNQADFRDLVNGQIDGLLLIVNILLGLAIIVAGLGIVNTIVLSVLERTREIGLLRAVGMTRRQLRAVVRWEGVIVCIFGALLGIGLGVLFASAALSAIPDSFISTVTIPWELLSYIVVASGVLGVLAAFFPARRAAKMDVLEAIATS